MKRKSISILFLAMLYWLLASPVAWAESKELSHRTARQVQIAYELQRKEKPDEAITVLTNLNPSGQYDFAYVNRMLGGLYWQTQQSQLAIKTLTLAINQKALPTVQQRDTQQMLADILLMEGQYKLAESHYQKLLPAYEQAKDLEWLWLRIAQAQYQQQEWARVELSIGHQQRYRQQAKLPLKVMPLNMLLGAQLARKKWQNAVPTALSLRTLEPDKYVWWRQLITLYIYTQQQQQALITLQQADRVGFELSDQYLMLMAQLYAQDGVPKKAAQTYARLKGLDSSATLRAQQAEYWQAAKEWDKAASIWLKAAQIDNKFYWQHALLLLKMRDYKRALISIDKLTNQTSQMLLAKTQALSAIGKKEQALQVATELHRIESSEESLRWIKYLSED
ncbi:hypothetical protein [Vibrio sp. VB16]|uniref:hypothetical protein n=1 Tax=Vibrio sp. VB16 TaxID=2785746 RepID=UPI00189C90A0|nr:hypothetical protein [Vibrio sp. VB16]UGA57283.1 hypothetical protein IUZ65_017435 [Vibrio sp. VB16]